ncbi:MAG: VWA domain-containing protein [Saprospiraceae bacterium]|nr:VWA domain-containing protein [Saprospiraceae bacterium]
MGEENEIRRKTRWKLALGHVDRIDEHSLSKTELQVDQVLDRLYQTNREGGLSKTRSVTARWMGEIKSLFPASVVRVLQRDALDRFGIKKLLSQPAFLDQIEPDVGLVATILSVKESLPPQALSVARQLVYRLARQVEQRLKFKLISRISGVRDQQSKIKNPHHQEIDWHLTIKRNLRFYQPELKTIIPDVILGRPRKTNQSKRLIILVDQSASMVESLIYAGILGSIMATIKSLKTHLVVFDTEVVDLSEYLHDPVELLMQSQLGGGTHIAKALGYAENIIRGESIDSFVVLISDLFEGAPLELLYDHVQSLINRSVVMISLLALDDQGTPAYDKEVAKKLSAMGVTCFACTPDQFPLLMASALNGEDLRHFAS